MSIKIPSLPILNILHSIHKQEDTHKDHGKGSVKKIHSVQIQVNGFIYSTSYNFAT